MLFSRPFWRWSVYFIVLVFFSNLNNSLSPWLPALAAKARFRQLYQQRALRTRHSSHRAAVKTWSTSLLFFVLHGSLKGADGWNSLFVLVWGFFKLSWSCDASASTTTKPAFHVCPLCSVPYLCAVRSNFSGSNNLLRTWQGVFRKPHWSPAAKDGLPSRRLFSLLQL